MLLFKESEEDLYAQMKALQRQLEFLDIQVQSALRLIVDSKREFLFLNFISRKNILRMKPEISSGN